MEVNNKIKIKEIEQEIERLVQMQYNREPSSRISEEMQHIQALAAAIRLNPRAELQPVHFNLYRRFF